MLPIYSYNYQLSLHHVQSNHIVCCMCRSQEGQTFLLDRTKKLQELLVENPSNSMAHASVSSFLHKLGRCKEALEHICKACKCGMKTKELLWKEEILRRQVEAEEARQLHVLGGRHLTMPIPQQVTLILTVIPTLQVIFVYYMVNRLRDGLPRVWVFLSFCSAIVYAGLQ